MAATSAPKLETPANVQEFNVIAGLIFAQLYTVFPGVQNIDRDSIAKAMGVSGTDWGKHKLPSGAKLRRNDGMDECVVGARRLYQSTGRPRCNRVGNVGERVCKRRVTVIEF